LFFILPNYPLTGIGGLKLAITMPTASYEEKIKT